MSGAKDLRACSYSLLESLQAARDLVSRTALKIHCRSSLVYLSTWGIAEVGPSARLTTGPARAEMGAESSSSLSLLEIEKISQKRPIGL